ncbi:MFS transporter [Luteimonas yindakuii]|uniref:MFS transporter n=1 Tax=Luteimonas yindakuii TaxID=2565782 RepID=A0A4Z1R5E2_9GAMM|nr:MFS transporter [Luteimonas yindakuii]QCO67820.1 MFS transporter [Luteimonas yindakuii]TKS54136.1 MFS transporter [Luteimonas yindakuii]
MSAAAPAAGADDSSRTAPLRNPGFRRLLAFRLCSILSYQIVAVTVGWQVYELTRNPWMLGLIGLAELLPYFCVAPFAGYLVDHLPRRRLGMAAGVGLALTPVLLALLTTRVIDAGVWAIYAAVVLTGMVRAFLGPVYNALFARVLPRAQFVRGASLGSIVFQSALVLGPAIGGVLVGWSGMASSYITAAVLALGVVVALAGMRVSEPAPVLQRAPIFSSIAEGARFVFGHQILLGALALDMFAVLFGGAISLAPAFIHDILAHGPEGLGILRGAPALGAVAVGIWLARNPIQRNAGRILLVAVACFGLCIIGFGLSRLFWLSAFFLLLSGVCDGVSVVMRSTILQLATPDEMRGRVSSINGLFVGSSNELGAFYAGSMARLLGLVPAVVLGGCVTISVALAAAWRAPRLRRLDLRDLQAGPLEAERGH